MQQDIKHITQALKFVWRSSPTLTILQLVVLTLQAILPLINLFIVKNLIDSIELQADQNKFDNNTIYYYIIWLAAILLFIAIANIAHRYISTAQQQRVSDYMSILLQKKSSEIDLQYYEDATYHDTLHRAQTQGLYRPVRVLNSITSILQNGLSITAIASLFLILHWGIAVVFILSALPALFIKIYYSRVLYDWQRKTTQMERESYYLNQLITNERYVKEMRVFNVANVFIEKFEQLRAKLFKEKMGIEGKQARAEIIGKTIETLATAVIYGFIAIRAAMGKITVGDFVLYFQAFQKGQGALKAMLTSLASLYDNRLFLKYIFEFLDIQPEVKNAASPIPLPKLQETVRLEDVHFAYPSSKGEKYVLKNINLEMKKGEVIALVGENGSGKTTLIKLLSRLYDVNKGRILFDDCDIREVELSDIRQKIGIIFQDFSKYYLTVRDNISISDLDQEVEDGRVRHAAQNTGADQFINQLPKKYDNMLGLQFRKGTELSGGQWQKIALARAFYKDADIIVLDEPTSAIDPIAEYEIFERFRALAKDKILILITHRLYNLKMANKIVVMQEGEIIETGTHQELADQRGQYFKMFEKQMS